MIHLFKKVFMRFWIINMEQNDAESLMIVQEFVTKRMKNAFS